MYISRLRLSNIRCFPDATVHLPPGVTLLVGENNSGKSTIIQSLYTLQAAAVLAPDTAIRYGGLSGAVYISLADAEPELFPDPTRSFLRSVPPLDVNVQLNLHKNPASILHRIHSAGRSTGFQAFQSVQPDNLIVPYLSDRRVGGYSESVAASAAFSVGSLHHLVAKIDTCFSSPLLNPLYHEASKQVLGFVATTWPTAGGKMAGLEIDPRRHQNIPFTQMGVGVAQALGLITELLLAEKKIFLIEELENDLHPSALRALLKLTERSAAGGNQFVISTHSNVVVRALGSIEGTRIWRTAPCSDNLLPECSVTEVPNERRARHALLQSVGYELSDYDLYDAWLILEEASAERIIREFIIPWFATGLSGRLRTVAAQGAQDVPPKFVDLHRLFLFAHLEPIYRERAWVITDGDVAGRAAVTELRSTFTTWPEDQFQWFPENDFERYYPTEFAAQSAAALALPHGEAQWRAKGELAEIVVAWLRADRERGIRSLAETAHEVIERIRAIERVVVSEASVPDYGSERTRNQ